MKLFTTLGSLHVHNEMEQASIVYFRKRLIGFPVSDVIRVLHKPKSFSEKLSKDTQKGYRWLSTCSLYIVSYNENKRRPEEGVESISSPA